MVQLYLYKTNGKTVREFFYNSGAEEFTANSISLFSSHLIDTPTDSATINCYRRKNRTVFFLS